MVDVKNKKGEQRGRDFVVRRPRIFAEDLQALRSRNIGGGTSPSSPRPFEKHIANDSCGCHFFTLPLTSSDLI